MRLRAALFVAVFAVAAASYGCSDAPPSANPSTGRWIFSGLVLERTDGQRGPIACFGAVLASLPPAGCGGWPIKGWDWTTAPDATEYTDVRTSYAVLIGHVEGDQFVLNEPPSARPANDTGNYRCVLIGEADEPTIEPATVNARFDTPDARTAGLYPTSPHTFDVSYGGDPAVSGWIGLTVLADTPKVRSFVMAELDNLRVQLCSVLRPE